jgi:N-acetylneuraminic acid mutarotase
MKHKRGFSGAVFLNGKIYVIGGNDGQRTLNYTEIYDTATDTWSYGQPMPTPRRGFAIAQLNGKIYCFGGYNLETRTTLTNAEVYDTVLNKWEKLPNMPFPRQGATAVTYNNRIYVLGGVMGTANSGNGPIFLRDMNYYLVKERQWENGPSLVFDRYYLTSVIHNNIIYAIGGIKGLRPLNIVETINIENGSTWVSKDELNLQSPRNASVAVYLNGVIYAIGGLGNEGELNTVESLRIE